MKTKMHNLKRTLYAVAAFAFVLAGIFQAIPATNAYAFPAGSQLVDREIRMSSSANGALTNGQNVTYLVAFEPATTYAVEGIIIDFCGGASASGGAGTPIINDSDCAIPDGFDIGTPTVDSTPADTEFTDLTDGTGTWTATDHFANGQTVRLTNPNGPTISTGTKYEFELSGITNPTDTETFYARIITYTSDTEDVTTYTHAAAEDGASTNEAEDYGGIAMSVANVINITARVRESLTFCVSLADPTANCGGTSQPDLLLNNGSEDIVDALGVSTASAFIQASTNAQSGVVVRIRNPATCAGLSRDGGTTCHLEAIGATGNTLASAVSPDGLFGMYVNDSGGATDLDNEAPYDTVGTYAFDDVSADGVSSLYGDMITQSTVPLDSVENTLVFGARASSTTPAGLYTAQLLVTATGTF